MDRSTERAYKRKCFQGRGAVARWMDRVFFAGLCGAGLYLLRGAFRLSLLLAAAALLLFILWDVRRWQRFRRRLRQSAADQLRREAWMGQAAETIRQAGGTVLYPTPDADALTGLCLRRGQGASFHCFGAAREDLIEQAAALGCAISFHPFGQGAEPAEEQVRERIRRDAPKKPDQLWRRLQLLPGNRYLLTGGLLLIGSIFLRRALYWRLLGTLCLLIGAIRRGTRLGTGI